jgi:hypothetical protein
MPSPRLRRYSRADLRPTATAAVRTHVDSRVAAVGARLGYDCDVRVFTPTEFEGRACGGEPVVSDILRDGVALVGTKPRVEQGAT